MTNHFRSDDDIRDRIEAALPMPEAMGIDDITRALIPVVRTLLDDAFERGSNHAAAAPARAWKYWAAGPCGKCGALRSYVPDLPAGPCPYCAVTDRKAAI